MWQACTLFFFFRRKPIKKISARRKTLWSSANMHQSSAALRSLMLLLLQHRKHCICCLLLYPRGLTTFHRIHRLGIGQPSSLPNNNTTGPTRQETRFISNEFLMNAGIHCGAAARTWAGERRAREHKKMYLKNKLIDASGGFDGFCGTVPLLRLRARHRISIRLANKARQMRRQRRQTLNSFMIISARLCNFCSFNCSRIFFSSTHVVIVARHHHVNQLLGSFGGILSRCSSSVLGVNQRRLVASRSLTPLSFTSYNILRHTAFERILGICKKNMYKNIRMKRAQHTTSMHEDARNTLQSSPKANEGGENENFFLRLKIFHIDQQEVINAVFQNFIQTLKN